MSGAIPSMGPAPFRPPDRPFRPFRPRGRRPAASCAASSAASLAACAFLACISFRYARVRTARASCASSASDARASLASVALRPSACAPSLRSRALAPATILWPTFFAADAANDAAQIPSNVPTSTLCIMSANWVFWTIRKWPIHPPLSHRKLSIALAKPHHAQLRPKYRVKPCTMAKCATGPTLTSCFPSFEPPFPRLPPAPFACC
mmetsp:Transcript_2749/g.11204  ORF Transcript_2749/g.11204 Transcript_2749/m.11204 type:complete len:207 (-) Transcript_2749:686-1306(-)